MRISRTVSETRQAVARARASGMKVGFVPTMGFLHEGHLSLIDAARSEGADFIVVSIFVNPTQFGPGEDFDRYPRDEERDRSLLEGRHVDLLFAPDPEVMYPPGATTRVRTGAVSEPLEGERRPGHFEGVATIVLKLFNIVLPDLAVFGRKDAQQCAVVARMLSDLDVAVKLLFAETIRDADGLAMSSRNAFLSAEERKIAPILHSALQSGARALQEGAPAQEARRAMVTTLGSAAQLDYLEVVDPQTFRAPAADAAELLVVGAVRVGRTRLIDNLIVQCSVPLAATSAGELTREARNDPAISSLQDSPGDRH